MNKKVNPYKACIYGLCRDFLDGIGYDLGTKILAVDGIRDERYWKPILSTQYFFLCDEVYEWRNNYGI